MKKNVYSLILSEEVVAAIDRAAYAKGMSRSGLINEILASAVSYKTPESWIKEAIDETRRILDRGTFVMIDSGATALSVRSAVKYKYNPSLRFGIELRKTSGGCEGELKISLRSRSDTLILLLIDFMKLWEDIERMFSPSVEYFYDNGKITRMLLPSSDKVTPTELGDAVAALAGSLNDAIGIYFENGCQRSPDVIDRVSAICAEYYRSGNMTV